MTARRLEGRAVAEVIWTSVEAEARHLAERVGRAPTLALVRGADEAADAYAYARQIERAFARRGLLARPVEAPADGDQMRRLVQALNADDALDGVLLLSPLPGGLALSEVVLDLDPARDVDGQHPRNLGALAQRRAGAFAPATALGGLRLLEHYGVLLAGARVAVVGRSPVVGMPLALLLLQRDATVTVCHSRTPDLAAETRRADVVCVATGQPGLIGPQHVRPGAVVVDFGVNPTPDGGLVGDAQTEALAEVAGALTPVPGGTGPVTVAVLAEQTVRAAAAHIT